MMNMMRSVFGQNNPSTNAKYCIEGKETSGSHCDK